MKQLTLHDKKFELSIPYADIAKVIEEVALQITQDLKDEHNPVFLSILNGSFMFTCDLLKHIPFNCEISFIKMASYEGTCTTGTVNEILGLDTIIEGRTVVIIEDIVDSGNTLEKLINILLKKYPKQLKIATLLYKPDAYTKNIKIDYIGKSIPNDFIIGFGLDYNKLGRNYPDIYSLVKK
ncbi:MAG: hypoxanthine phosphoribosyltransferase [Prevotellaceae bacterium]|jgi:hypoxanthine phosphoribosyltransferase|nr:hypoxanthine phosphoribosyltransferase [Prevotellaceae bacterium]